MNDTKRHLLERLPGSFGLRNGHGFAFGEHPSIATLPLCEPARAGEKRRIPGGTGVADTEVTCQKGADDTWEWVEASDLNPVSLTAAWVLIEDPTEFSAASSVSLDDVFSATYENYAVIYRYTQSANAQVNMRLRVGGVDAGGASDYYLVLNRSSTAAFSLTAAGNVARSNIPIHTAPGVANSIIDGTIFVASPFATAETHVGVDTFGMTTSTAFRDAGAGSRAATTSYDGFSIIPASGTITGTIRVYGIQDSIGDGFTGYNDEAARDAIGAALVAGANTTITVDDALNTITIASTGGGGSSSIADILMLGGM
jgi:hypothetical protein